MHIFSDCHQLKKLRYRSDAHVKSWDAEHTEINLTFSLKMNIFIDLLRPR